MDSANSGSIQSSSGGDEEYDSRADSFSALFHPPSSSSAAAASFPTPNFSSSHPNSLFFNSLAFLDHSQLLPTASSSSPCPPRPSPTPTPDFPSFPPPSSSSALPRGPQIAQSSVQQLPDNPTPTVAPPRSSKKRSRASRRAPTTVLTTDTSNFRAMVQEFTGIPSTPFSAASSSTLSPFSRSRFDLFHSSASPASSLPPPYLRLRPFAQKPPTFPSLNPSSSTTTTAIIDALASTCDTISNANATSSIPITTAAACTTSNSTHTNNNHQLPSPDFGLSSQSQTLFNLQSQGPIINFQSLLTHKDTLPTMPAFATRPQAVIPSAEFASGVLGLPPGLIGSEGMHSGWARASGPDSGHQAQARPVVGGHYNGAQQRVSSCKLNYSAPGPSEFNAEKGSEGVAARGEGMVDSWICSSD
ncbi:putative nuclear pore complex protein [Cocos nucifera]|uniref:Putative nuclear pore complex protein n=1 Tax=Cocos nucifera TaxID=13894 RepID=A0A8K0ITA7_COCNU|nr:putative nuclear pore complex protein [Cocos nucifera]